MPVILMHDSIERYKAEAARSALHVCVTLGLHSEEVARLLATTMVNAYLTGATEAFKATVDFMQEKLPGTPVV